MRRVVTITANTTIDQTLFISSFQPGKTIRATQSIFSMGGKPTDVAYVLGQMAQPCLAIGFAAGIIGQRVRSTLGEVGVEVDFVEVEGESRLNVLVATEDDGQLTTITGDTLRVNRDHIAALIERLEAVLPDAACVMMGGTLPSTVPPTHFADWIVRVRAHGVPVLFDADEPSLSAGLQAQPDFIKPNRDELAHLVGIPVVTMDEVYEAGRDILTRFGTSVIVTLGSDGALAVLRDATWYIPSLDVPVVSTAGAGDAVMAGLAEAICRQEPIEMGLRRGFAYAAAVIQKPGTAQLDPREAQRLLPLVRIIPYNEYSRG